MYANSYARMTFSHESVRRFQRLVVCCCCLMLLVTLKPAVTMCVAFMAKRLPLR